MLKHFHFLSWLSYKCISPAKSVPNSCTTEKRPEAGVLKKQQRKNRGRGEHKWPPQQSHSARLEGLMWSWVRQQCSHAESCSLFWDCVHFSVFAPQIGQSASQLAERGYLFFFSNNDSGCFSEISVQIRFFFFFHPHPLNSDANISRTGCTTDSHLFRTHLVFFV